MNSYGYSIALFFHLLSLVAGVRPQLFPATPHYACAPPQARPKSSGGER